MKNIKVIGFDADDTLWMNENYYRSSEEKYAELLSDFGEKEFILSELFNTEMQNLKIFGYGVKPFVISMIENAIRLSESRIEQGIITEIICMGKAMLDEPVVLLPGVKEVLDKLYGHCRLIVATKGDILDQERKLKRSSLSKYFHHIEVMSDKTPETYSELLDHLEIEPEQFVMMGNSLRSDILAPYELGCYSIHIPYEMTWQHEMDVVEPPLGDRFKKVESISEVLQFFDCE